MGWFKRIKEGITTSTNEKKEMPDGLWIKCPKCQNIITSKEHEKNLYVCLNCNFHDSNYKTVASMNVKLEDKSKSFDLIWF